MEQWSILYNILNYIQHDRHHMINCNFSIKTVNKHKNSLETQGEREITELDFGVTPRILCEEYLEVYEGIQSEMVNTMRFDKNSDSSTTYLGKSDVVYQSWLFLSLHCDALLLCMCYIINTICTCAI